MVGYCCSNLCDWSRSQVAQIRDLFCSLRILDPRVGHTMDVVSLFTSTSLILTDSSTGNPVHVLMLSIQAVRGLPRLRAPGIVPCIMSFSRQLPCFLMVGPQYASFLALTVSNSFGFPLYSRFVTNPLICFLCYPRNPQNLSKPFHLKGVKSKTCFFILFECPVILAIHCYGLH